MAHSKFSPSSMHSILDCKPSLLVPSPATVTSGGDDSGNEYTREGDIAHGLCEWSLIESGDVWDRLGEVIDGITVDREMCEGVGYFVSSVHALLEEHPSAELHVETRIVHDRVPEFGGTIDCLIVTDNEIFILDFKYGAGIWVDVVANSQLLCYSLLALNEFGVSGANGQPRQVHFTVVQPRRGKEAVRQWSPSHDDLTDFGNRLLAHIKWIREQSGRQEAGELVFLDLLHTDMENGDHEYGSYRPSPGNCRFCKAKTSCPALCLAYGRILALAEIGEAEEMDADTIVKVYKMGQPVRKYIEACEQEIHDRLAAGEKIEGYKLVEKLSNRQWKIDSTLGFTNMLAGYLGERGFVVSKDEVRVDSEKNSPAQLQKLGVPREEIDKYTAQHVTGTKIVPEEAYGTDLNAPTAQELLAAVNQ